MRSSVVTTPDQQQIREDIAKATRMASFAADSLTMHHRQRLDACTPVDRTGLIVQAAVAYLLGHGLATIAPAEAWEQFLPADIAEPYQADLLTTLDEAVQRQANINRSLGQGGLRG